MSLSARSDRESALSRVSEKTGSGPPEVVTAPAAGQDMPPRLLAAVAAMRGGGMVVVVDDPLRENEGDLVMAANCVTPRAVNFMATHARGLICVAMRRGRLDELGIAPMTRSPTDHRGTAFHVGVDLRGQSTGISAHERSQTIRALADPATPAHRFTQPGHVFPLAYQPGGVISRAGHTEASVELTVLAGLEPAAVMCEIAADDGSMMRLPELQGFAETHRLPLVFVSELRDYLLAARPPVIERVSQAQVPLRQGMFTFVGYREHPNGREHLAAVFGQVSGVAPVLARVHSECLTGDVFGSLRCDCGQQLETALTAVADNGAGVVIYLRGHEGRGIGLLEKLSAYQLQDRGLDTVEANEALGYPADVRDYAIGAAILADLGIESVRLITNNPAKRAALVGHGIRVLEIVDAATEPTAENVRYLSTKRMKLGHDVDVGGLVGHSS
jgi:3,4-dihydroxy 2-butanone 4-phosphate synthase/GTP cyclohydrolase II